VLENAWQVDPAAFSYQIVRPFNVAGPLQRADKGFVMPRFIAQARADAPLTVYGDGAQRRAFLKIKLLYIHHKKLTEIQPAMNTLNYNATGNRSSPTPAWLNRGFRFGEWSIIPTENSIRRDDRRIRLEPKVMQLLLALIAKHDEPCTRNELLDQLWPSPDTGESSLTRAISELRKALGDQRNPAQYIDTIQRIGYKAIAPIRPLTRTKQQVPESEPARTMSQAEEVIAMARYLLVRRNHQDIHLAVDVLQKHLEERPHQAQAWALLAHARSLIYLYSDEPAALHIRSSRKNAEQALELDGANGLAWAVLGRLAHEQWQWPEALEQYQRAYAFQPLDPIVLHGYAELLLHLGRIDAAKAMMKQACQLQPLAASAHLVLGWMLLHGEQERAREELEKARQLGADAVFTDNLHCLLLHREGWTETRIKQWAELNQRRQEQSDWMWPKYLVDALIERKPTPTLVANIRERVQLGQLDSGIAPFMLTIAGALDTAFELAQTAIEEQRFFIIDPWLAEMAPFRQDPRFSGIQRALGLDSLEPD
ncbi:MAG: winged helix-turn-helix domain-containing protein, partial [Pseudomonadota bacterium]